MPTATARAAITFNALPMQVDLVLYAGDDFFIDLTVMAPDGSPADLTGSVATAQIRPTPGSAELIAEFDAVIEDNVIHLHLPASEAAKLVAGTSAWDCQLDTAGVIATQVRGLITATWDVTR
jgi:hypothetical protein